MKKQKAGIAADKPLTDPELDKFGYKHFAKHLASSLKKMPAVEGLVVALYGEWGSGKTTITNFISHYLAKEKKEDQPVIIRFNPWWFSGDENLFRVFFSQIRAALKKEDFLEKKSMKMLGDLLEKIADAWDDLPWWGKVPIRILHGKPKPDIVDVKNKISKILQDQDKKIIIIIDDIDRLAPEEVRQIFRLVKAVADFPNVIYLLAFDKRVAVAALSDINGIDGEEYLEKIVQVPFDVPLPEKSQMNELFIEKLNVIFADADNNDFDREHWQRVYFDGIEDYITTPRKIVKLINALTVTYPAVAGEVNVIDLLAIEAIRVFSPDAFEIIRKNPKEFTGTSRSYSYDNEAGKEKFRKYHMAWLEKMQEHEKPILKHILPQIFPKLRIAFGGYGSDNEDVSEWNRLNRVCHEDIFPTFFRLSLSNKTVSSAEIEALIKLSADETAFAKKLQDYTLQVYSDHTTRLKYVLERLRDSINPAPPTLNKQNVLNVLFAIGDELLIEGDKSYDMFGFGNSERIGQVFWRLLDTKDKEKNYKFLKTAITKGDAVYAMTRQLHALGEQHGKYKASEDLEDEKVLTLNRLTELEKLAANRMTALANAGKLHNVKRIRTPLLLWKEWGGEQAPKQWMGKVIQSDKDLVTLLTNFAAHVVSLSSSGNKKRPRLDPDWLKEFLTDKQIEDIIERVKKLVCKKTITGEQKEALEQLLKEHEIRKAGKDPENPLSWR